MWYGVTIDGFWTEYRIYWTLRYRAWPHFTVHYYTHASVHSHVFTAVAYGGRSFSSGFPNCPWSQLPASHRNTKQPQQSSNYLINCNEVKVMLRPTVSRSGLSSCQAPIWGPITDFYYCQTVEGLFMWGRPLWREDGSVVYNCCWP
jgi:hypothetical protein